VEKLITLIWQTNTQVLINNLKQDCARLSSKIVRNPEKLKLAIADMHRSLKEDKASVVASEKKARELHAKLQVMSCVEDVSASFCLSPFCSSF
jgi:hypothetical protein